MASDTVSPVTFYYRASTTDHPYAEITYGVDGVVTSLNAPQVVMPKRKPQWLLDTQRKIAARFGLPNPA